MVHRQADSRLLSNLIQQEKEYSKQVNQLLDTSCAALAALAAYAASSPPPVSHVIMELTGTLGAADAALKRYALGVDEWRETMRTLKDAEEEVGNIMRDREILVTRLIKASKSQKSGVRESLLLSPQRFPSSSSLSLSTTGQNESPSPPPSRPLSSSFSTSSKLAAAQTELQACEAHLASKERELEQKRSAAIRDGLGIRMKAMMDCGWVWNELGKEALRTLDQLRKPSDMLPQDEPSSRSDSRAGAGEGLRPFSDFSSIGPSQSVSQVNSMHNAPPPVSMAAVMSTGAFGEALHDDDNHAIDDDHDIDDNRDIDDDRHEPAAGEPAEHTEGQLRIQPTTANGRQQQVSDSSNGSSSLSKQLATPTTYKIETVTYAPAVPLFVAGKELFIAGAGKDGPIAGKDGPIAGKDGPIAGKDGPIPPAAAGTSTKEKEKEKTKKKAESVKSDYSSIHVPPPHAIEGYTYGYPTAAAPSGLNSNANANLNANSNLDLNANLNSNSKEDVISSRSTPTTSPAPTSTSPAPTPQRRSSFSFTAPPIISAFHTHRLERRITEEDVRRRSLGGTSTSTSEMEHNEGKEKEGKEKKEEEEEDDALDHAETLLQEGKLAVVENPRFMSEARKREVEAEAEKENEKERARRAEEAGVSPAAQEQADGPVAMRKQQQEALAVDDEVARTPSKEKKRFAFFHSGGKDTTTPIKGPASRPPMHRAHDSDAHLSVVVSDAGKSTHTSPAKGGFFGGIKSLFGPKHLSPHSSPSKLQDSPVLVDRDDMDDSDDDAPTKRTLSKRRGLFSSSSSTPGSGEKRQKGKGWETRTDKNLRAITRAASFERDRERSSYPYPYQAKAGVGVGVGARAVAGVGLGAAPITAAASNVGGSVALPRNRVPSEVGTAPTAPGIVQGRKLKKRGPGHGPVAGSPGATVSDGENYFETRPATNAAAPLPLSVPRAPPAQPRPSAPAASAVASAGPGPGWVTNEHRRRSSVDGAMGNRKSWTEDENGAMIVDLGRRRVASEVSMGAALPPGGAAVMAARTVGAENRPLLKSAMHAPQSQGQQYQQHHAHAAHVHMQAQLQPRYQPQPQTQTQTQTGSAAHKKPGDVAAHREYASDTGVAPSALGARKKSLTKKKPPQAPESTVSMSALPPPVPVSPLLSSLGPPVATPPVRRASVKSTATAAATSTHPPPPPPPATAAAAAKKEKAKTSTIGGATVMPAEGRHPSGTLVSEPGWAAQAHTQGGALARNTSSASAGSNSAAAASRKKQTVLGQGMGTSGENRRAASSLGPAAGVQTAAAAAAPASHSHSQHARAASGGTGTLLIQPLGPAASLMSIVEDVARVNRDGWGGAGAGGAGGRDTNVQRSVDGSQVPTGMMDVVKAPPPMGRKFYEAMGDQRTAAQVPMAPTPPTVSRTGMFEVTAPRSVFEQRESLAQSTAMFSTTAPAPPKQPQPQAHPPPVGPGKVPLRSALRTSRSPSPVITTSRAQESPSTKPLPPPVDGRLPWDGDNASTPRFTKAEKGKAPVRGPPPPDEESGEESDYETGDEMLDAQDTVGPDGRPKFVRRSSSGRRNQAAAPPPPPPAINGHAPGYEQGDKPREPQMEHSAASTVVGQQQPQSVVSSAVSQDQGPRRRKSVRVSLQPTFSPSPPAIEYDEEEEQKVHAPWAFGAERRIERERQPMVVQAPAPVYPQPAQTVASSHVVDMWADSDEEDEAYLKAKRMLSRAAKKEKDVSRMVANRA